MRDKDIIKLNTFLGERRKSFRNLTAGFGMGQRAKERWQGRGKGRYFSLPSTPDGVCRVSKYLDYAWYKQPEIIPRCNVNVNVNHKITHNSKSNRLQIQVIPVPSSPSLSSASSLPSSSSLISFFSLPHPPLFSFFLYLFHITLVFPTTKLRSLSIFFIVIMLVSSLFLQLRLRLLIFIRLCLLLSFLYLLLLLYLFFLPFLLFLSFFCSSSFFPPSRS